MKEIGFHQLGPPLLHYDNQLCIILTKNPCHDNRSKHIDIKHHYHHEKIEHENIIVLYYPIEDMIGNLLIKALPKTKIFTKFARKSTRKTPEYLSQFRLRSRSSSSYVHHHLLGQVAGTTENSNNQPSPHKIELFITHSPR
jgi:hypothetical protein